MLDESDARHLAHLERAILVTDPVFLRRFARAASALPAPPGRACCGPVVVAVDDSASAREAVRWAASYAVTPRSGLTARSPWRGREADGCCGTQTAPSW